MEIREEVTEADRMAVPSDFSSGDLVYVGTVSPSAFGVVGDATEQRIVIYTANKKFIFDGMSTPTLTEALPYINKRISESLIKPKTVLSHIIELSDGEFFREHVEVIEAEPSERGSLEVVTVSVLNGERKGKTYIMFDDSVSSLMEKLSTWQLED